MTAKIVLRAPNPGGNMDSGGLNRELVHLLREKAMRRPGFSGCWTVEVLPTGHEVLESYEVLEAKVSVVSTERGGEMLYHVRPWEYGLTDTWISAMTKVIAKIAHLPPPTLATSLHELRSHVRSSSSRLLHAMVSSGQLDVGRGVDEREANIGSMTEVVVRHTVGLGLFEVLLADDRIEDVYVDAPSADNRVHVTVNGVRGSNAICRCVTNITASAHEVDKLASRLRQSSGRPFSEAFPIMETDVEGFESRATVIGPPLSPGGTALALRRHSRLPWTLPKLAYNGSIDVSLLGLLSFLMDGRTAMLICGARGADKQTLLSAMRLECSPSQTLLTP